MGEIFLRWQPLRVNDFERIARIIRMLDENHADQPSLDDLAREACLSPFHFHRLFTRWAGATPKEFIQCLTHAHARKMLHSGTNVPDAALQSGLSGPGRLHDLCVSIEAASPGELKSGGEGITIRHGMAETPFGQAILGETGRGVCHLRFGDSKKAALRELESEWPNAKLQRDNNRAEQIAKRVFSKSAKRNRSRPLRAFVKGSGFQVKVWRALTMIPVGSLVSYGGLARLIGSDRAARAVGTAVGANPLACLIPCHRVIRETGIVGQYRWGRERKRALIAWEATA